MKYAAHNTEFMLLFSLGPVQSFITQARKARDLWTGSFLLSLLMEACMQDIAPSALIFPALPVIDHVTKNIADLPNKYVARFESLSDARMAALNSTKRIEDCWLSICEDVWQHCIFPFTTGDDKVTRAIWERQINPQTFFEIFWVIVERGGNDYHTWLQQTQEALAARKRSRPVRWQDSFHPEQVHKPLWDEPGEKSTISGEREALHGPETSRAAVRTFWQQIAATFPHDINQQGEERLDAIDTVKRFAFHAHLLSAKNIDTNFPSTSSIATASYVKQLLTNTIPPADSYDWLQATREPLDQTAISTLPALQQLAGEQVAKRALLKRDGDCFFPETFTAYRLQKDYALAPHEAVRRAQSGKKALNKLLAATDRAGITRPTPYYAMLLMDGDKMGPLVSSVPNEQEHSAISRAISTFSRTLAPALVHEQYPGKLIYAGGDDTFALAPLTHDSTVHNTQEQTDPPSLTTVLALAEQLQRTYCAEVRSVVTGEARKNSVTTSAGIAIVHHYTALSSVRRIAKEAEDLAKKHYGRNALVVIIVRRSGEQTRVGCHWEHTIIHDGKLLLIRPLALFAEFYTLFTQELLSSHSVYAMLAEAPTLIALKPEAQQSEIVRILQHQHDLRKKLPPQHIRSLARQITELAHAIDNDERRPFDREPFAVTLHSEERRAGLIEIIGWLLVLLFLARKDYE